MRSLTAGHLVVKVYKANNYDNSISLVLGGLILGWTSSFLNKNGEIKATKQDISTITDKIESVKYKHTTELEKLKSELQHKTIAKDEKREVYKKAFQADSIAVRILARSLNAEAV